MAADSSSIHLDIRPLQGSEAARYSRLQLELFPDKTTVEVQREIDAWLATGLLHGTTGAILLGWQEDQIVGFVEVALHPIAIGCTSNPVGMVEGLFVRPTERGKGYSQQLLDAAAAWALACGCCELASSCEIENEASRRSHLKAGFSEAGRSIAFIRVIGTPSVGIGLNAADNDWIALQAAPLDVSSALRFVADPAAGGIDLFLGTTRAEMNAAGQQLLALDYEAYPEMAIEKMKQLAAEARRRWPICKLALLHRTGRVGLAEPSVAIAVACPHRGEAFEACRWLIDALKADVPIWKKEIWQDGAATWVHR